MHGVMKMLDITADNLAEWIAKTDDPDGLKELIPHALKLQREDLIEVIVEKSIQINHLLDKLKSFDLLETEN